MRLASNVVVHDPEVVHGRIESSRLRAHGWSEEVVQQLQDSSQTARVSAERPPKSA